MSEALEPVRAAAPIDIWFDFGSNYSHISVMRIERDAAGRGVPVVWKPFLLGPIFKALGWETSPFILYKPLGDYMWQTWAVSARSTACRGDSRPSFPGYRYCHCGWP